jgi:hypothetical protein
VIWLVPIHLKNGIKSLLIIKYNADYITSLSLQEYHRHILPDSDDDEEEVITDNELDEGNGIYA